LAVVIHSVTMLTYVPSDHSPALSQLACYLLWNW